MATLPEADLQWQEMQLRFEVECDLNLKGVICVNVIDAKSLYVDNAARIAEAKLMCACLGEVTEITRVKLSKLPLDWIHLIGDSPRQCVYMKD